MLLKPALLIFCSMFVLSGLFCCQTMACSSGDTYVSVFQRTVRDLEDDLASVRSGRLKFSRFNLTFLERELRENMDCVEKVCTLEQQKEILKDWKRFMEIKQSGELRSPRPLVDPVPRR